MFENGDVTTHSLGTGGILGGGIVWLGDPSNVCAAESNVFLVSVTGSQPPPFQNPD